MRLRNVSIRQDIQRLTLELSSGQVSDVRDVLAGNYSYLTDIERRSDILSGFKVATTEASLYAGAVQNSLEVFADQGANFARTLVSIGTSGTGIASANTSAEAENALAGMISAINTNSAGRYLFSGAAVDQAPLADSDTLLAGLRAATAGLLNPDDVIAAADAWFNDPAGFEATMYGGSADQLEPFDLSEGDKVNLDMRATDPRLREVLKMTALSAIADDGAFGFSTQTKVEFFEKTGSALLIAQDDIISMRADVGFAEARIEQVATRNEAEQTSLEFARSNLLAIDPYEAATKLEEVQFQLQSLYSVTVRMSQLSLVNYI